MYNKYILFINKTNSKIMKRIMTILALMMFVVVGASAQGLESIQTFGQNDAPIIDAPMLKIDKDFHDAQFVNNPSKNAAPVQAKATEEGWKSLGDATFVDGLIYYSYKDVTATYNVEVQQSTTNANLYRFVEPYGAGHSKFSVLKGLATYTKGVYVEFDATDPNNVTIKKQKTGWSDSFGGDIYVQAKGGTFKGGELTFPEKAVQAVQGSDAWNCSLSASIESLKWSSWEPFTPGGTNYAKYTFKALTSGVQDSLQVFVRTSTADTNQKQIKIEKWGAGKLSDDGVDLIIEWNSKTDSCKVAVQSTGLFNTYYNKYICVMDYPTFYSKTSYTKAPSLYDSETGVFSLYLGYTLASYAGTGAGFGSGVETLSMYGVKNYKITDYHLGNTVEDTKTGTATQWFSVTSPDATKFRYTLATSSQIKSSADILAIAKSLTGDYANPDSLFATVPAIEDVYYFIVASYSDEGVIKSYASKYFYYSPSSNWKSIGYGTITDDILVDEYSSLGYVTTTVEIQESRKYPNVFRVKNPYGANYKWYSSNGFKREDTYLYINAQNANAVKLNYPLTYQDLGISLGGGEFCIYQLPATASASYYGKLDGDSITFPAKGIVYYEGNGSGYYGNKSGKFCVRLPQTIERKLWNITKYSAAAGKNATINLEAGQTYLLTNEAPAKLTNITINGNGATVVVGPAGQFTAMQGLTINNVNFDCTYGKLAPVALAATPDSSLSAKKNDFYGSQRTKAFYDTLGVYINECNFSNLQTSLFSANKAPWCLTNLKLDKVVAQFNYASGDPIINFYGNSEYEGAIKNLVISNSTLYNIQEKNNVYFIRFANASNGQATKAFPNDPKEYITFTNNTFVNMPSNANFGNNTQNNNGFVDDLKGNVFYNTYRISKYIQSNNDRTAFTAADNAICGVTNSIDASDLKNIATEDTLLCKGDAPFVVPTTSLDLSNVEAIKANFTPSRQSYAHNNRCGDPRWLDELFKKTYQYVHQDSVLYMVENDAMALAYLGNMNNDDIDNHFVNFQFQSAKSTTNPEFEKAESKYRQGVVVGTDAAKTIYVRIYADANATAYLYATPFTDAETSVLSVVLNDETGIEISGATGESVVAPVVLVEGYNELKITASADMSFYALKVKYNKTGSATGISEVETENTNSAAIYNLRGQKVSCMERGQVYIVNGHKFLAK